MTHSKLSTNILAIECAVGIGSVSVIKNMAVAASTVGRLDRPSRAEEVLAVIASLIEQATLRLDDLNLIAVSTGPGSYSGIRIGLATALGLKNSLKIQSVGVSTLDAMALFAPNRSVATICAVPVGKKDVAWRLYEKRNGQPVPLGAPEIGAGSDFVRASRDNPDPTIFLHSDLLERLTNDEIPRGRTVDAGSNLSEMIGLAASSLGDPSLRPIYLRNRAHAEGAVGP